jgi:hypothetical protein
VADIIWSDVVDVASELATGVSSGFQTKILGYVNEAVNPRSFGGDPSFGYDLARAYLAAHYALYYKLKAAAEQGPQTSESEGGVSESFSAPTMANQSIFNATRYGRLFLSLMNPGHFVTGMRR